MSKQGKRPSFVATFIKDLLFVGPFFLISFLVLKPSVPSHDPFWINFWAGLVGLAMAGGGWLALQMFKVVLADQLDANRARSESAK